MKSGFWRVKPQLRTKLSTRIVDTKKNPLHSHHLKKILRIHIKTLAQLALATLYQKPPNRATGEPA